MNTWKKEEDHVIEDLVYDLIWEISTNGDLGYLKNVVWGIVMDAYLTGLYEGTVKGKKI
jgi:hypothetical protein